MVAGCCRASRTRSLIEMEAFQIFRFAAQLVAYALMAAMILLVAIPWASLPDQVPTHFNAAGEVDDFGSRSTLLVIPLIGIAIFVLLSWAERNPSKLNYSIKPTEENRNRLYRLGSDLALYLKVITTATLCYITYSVVQSARGSEQGLGIAFLPVVLVLNLGLLIYVLWRMSRLAT